MRLWNPLVRSTLAQASRELPADPEAAGRAGRRELLAIVCSGDGGWAQIDRQLSAAFVAEGIAVVGISTLRYFWHARAPQAAALELDALLTRYCRRWRRRRVWLVGFSFGADVLPTLVAGLSPANRARVVQLVLLSPSPRITFEIRLENYVTGAGRLARAVHAVLGWLRHVPHHDPLARVAALGGRPPVVCYHGTRDRTLCSTQVLPAWVEIHALHGGHHLGRDYMALARRLLDGVPATA